MTPRERPNQFDVLGAIVPGRTVRLELTVDQKKALQDPEGQLALHILRHTLAARTHSVPGDPAADFPLTGGFIQAAAAKLGERIGEKKADRLRARLVAAGVMTPIGSYRPNYRNQAGDGTHRVSLWRLAVQSLGYVLPATSKASVRKRVRVKRPERRRWWQHALFGTPDGLPPPDLTPARRRRLRSDDELQPTWC